MAIKEIPLRNDILHYDFRVDLDGETFTLTLRYNVRMARWILDIADSDAVPLAVGIPLLLGITLTGRFKIEALPAGHLFLINLQDANTEATEDDIGDNSKLLYSEAI